ncbi:MAG: transcriptional regulator NrdR [Candidatus Nanohaloarchaeota archaeon QJJ-5]|nr:transcriptional regulator NrdR [Candidatus Nanohaloarchaeota archaeon QJJ-5]
MQCPYCDEPGTSVVDTRETSDNEVRRRRECSACGERFTTYERHESPSLTVVKRDGEEEPFDRDKLRTGIERACNKRPLAEDDIEDLVDTIESRIRAKDLKSVTAEEIGEIAMSTLKETDEVAYLRFASVYRDFDDVDSFEEELEELK